MRHVARTSHPGWLLAALLSAAGVCLGAEGRGPGGVVNAPDEGRTARGQTWTNPTDGSEMVLIPAGSFKMGDGSEAHDVQVDAFYLGKCEVTNKQFKKFVDANADWRKDRIKKEFHDGDYLEDWSGDTYPADKAEHPVVNPYKADDGREGLNDAGSRRVVRCGSWNYVGVYCRSAYRNIFTPTCCNARCGFRLSVAARAPR
jgi:formylglycine-generating enzyme required for sulfatase activity